jgi:hypothetical protein
MYRTRVSSLIRLAGQLLASPSFRRRWCRRRVFSGFVHQLDVIFGW